MSENIEHSIAPRLEHDVYQFYFDVRCNKPRSEQSYEEYEKELMQKWVKYFSEYFKDWNFMLTYCQEFEFSFWINCFNNAYISTKMEINKELIFLEPVEPNEIKKLIQNTLNKLKQLFKTTGFIEDLQQKNCKYEKRIAKIQKDYSEVSKLSVDAPDLKFYLVYKDGFDVIKDIQNVVKEFRVFLTLLKSQRWYQSKVIFTFYQVVKVSKQKHYAIRFYLTIHKSFYSQEIDYLQLLNQLWERATTYLGVIHANEKITTNESLALDSNENPFVITDEPMSALENLDILPSSLTAVRQNEEKLCISVKGFKDFDGFSRP